MLCVYTFVFGVVLESKWTKSANNSIIAFADSPFGAVLVYIILHPGETASMILLALFGGIIAMAVLIVHRLLWRMLLRI